MPTPRLAVPGGLSPLLLPLLLAGLCESRAAADSFAVSGGLILAGGSGGRQVAELPPGLEPLLVLAEPTGQDLLLLGRRFVEQRDAAPAQESGLSRAGTLSLLRYGRTYGQGDLRLLLQAPSVPVPLSDPSSIRAALCGAHTGSVVAVAPGSGTQVWFLDAHTGAVLAGGQAGGQVPEGCAGVLTSGTQGPPPALSAELPARRFELSERVVDLTLPAAATTKVQRRVQVQLDGDGPESIAIDPGTCRATRFVAGGLFDATLKDAKEIDLSATTSRQALGVEQGAPGEDCVAALVDGTGEVLLRVRGGGEGGSTVLLVDRSFSMERSLLGAGAGSATDSRAEATRRGLQLLLGTLTVLPDGTSGDWAVLPFTDDVAPTQAAPLQGLAPIAVLGNPDRPDGLRIKGFAGGQGDDLDPGGPTDLLPALQQGQSRLLGADSSPGQRRRLWLWTDGLLPKAEAADYAAQVPALAQLGADLHVFGVGGLLWDQVLTGLSAQANGLYEATGGLPRGELEFHHSQIDLNEALVTAVAREVMHGRDIGPLLRGEVQGGSAAGAKALSSQFMLPGMATQTDAWVLVLGAWEHADATMNLLVTVNDGLSVHARCVRTATAQVCAAAGIKGTWQATLQGMRGSGPEPALLNAYVAGTGPSGQVGMTPSFGRSLYRTGDTVRVTVRLTELGLPLRLAKVKAQVTVPGGAPGMLAALLPTDGDAVLGLEQGDGDLTAGQAKGELLDPAALPVDKTQTIQLLDDGNMEDGEAADGVYTGTFVAALPGRYGVDLHVEYNGVLTPPGVIDGHIGTSVVTGLDLVPGTVTQSPLRGLGRLQVTVLPQDKSGNLLGPGQTSSLGFVQGQRLLSARVTDLLDGHYQAEIYGIAANVPLELRTPGGQITLLSAGEIPQVPGTEGGCAVGRGPAASSASAGWAGLALIFVFLVRRRTRLLQLRGTDGHRGHDNPLAVHVDGILPGQLPFDLLLVRGHEHCQRRCGQALALRIARRLLLLGPTNQRRARNTEVLVGLDRAVGGEFTPAGLLARPGQVAPRAGAGLPYRAPAESGSRPCIFAGLRPWDRRPAKCRQPK